MDDRRIIPARAGFTSLPKPCPCSSRDHPRSRGVYQCFMDDGGQATGSSPLARGLHRERTRGKRPTGIIPARAGFTRRRIARSASRRDHPRSRGVYKGRRDYETLREGSSPLARGLPTRGRRPGGSRGIIPARAGFTDYDRDRVRTEWDHPRSRGVYDDAVSHTIPARGSSPLARGLRREAQADHSRTRIIPARAGFTRRHRRKRRRRHGSSPLARGLRITTAAYTRALGDHPRSRGVYLGRRRGRVHDVGSSPLARGLLLGVILEPLGVGIIPARAGFTLAAALRSRSCRDHPRSRGVYLRVQFAELVAAVDHPRSRGVYLQAARHSWTLPGSSPLARGLPPGSTNEYAIHRIIPARAGFTRPSLPAPRRQRDHPRSRGVYGLGGVAWVA